MTNVSTSLDLDSLLNEISSGDLDETQLNLIIKVLYHVNQEIVVSKKGQTFKLNLNQEEIDFAFAYLLDRDFFQVDIVNKVEIYSLSDKTKDKFNDVIKDLRVFRKFQSLIRTIEKEESLTNQNGDRITPSFIGCFIADKAGKTLLTFELFKGALESFLKDKNINKPLNEDFDIELIPMFVSALEKFSQNINMQELSELRLTGINLKIQTYTYDKFTVTFLINPSVELGAIEDKIKDYFLVLFEKYKDEFALTLRTGIVDNISHLQAIGMEMLKELNKYVYLVEFNNIIINLDKYDQSHAKTLYAECNNLFNDCQLKFSLMLEKIKKLKIYLLKTMLNDDLDEFRTIIKSVQDINSKLNNL